MMSDSSLVANLRSELKALEKCDRGELRTRLHRVEDLIFKISSSSLATEYAQFFIYLILEKGGEDSEDILIRLARLSIPNVYPGIVSWVVSGMEEKEQDRHLALIQVWTAWIPKNKLLENTDLDGTLKAYNILFNPYRSLFTGKIAHPVIASFLSRLVRSFPWPLDSGAADALLSHYLDSGWTNVLASIEEWGRDVPLLVKTHIARRIEAFIDNIFNQQPLLLEPFQQVFDSMEKLAQLLCLEPLSENPSRPSFYMFAAMNPKIPMSLSFRNFADPAELFAFGFALSKRFPQHTKARAHLFINTSILSVLHMSLSDNSMIHGIGCDLLKQYTNHRGFASVETLIASVSDTIADSLITLLRTSEADAHTVIKLDSFTRVVETLVSHPAEISGCVLIDLARVILKSYKPRNFPLWALKGLHAIIKGVGFAENKLHGNEKLSSAEIMANEVISRTKYCIDISVDTESKSSAQNIVEKSVMATIVCMEAVRTLKRSHEVQTVKLCELLNLFVPSMNESNSDLNELDIKLVAAIEVVISIGSMDSRVIDFFQNRVDSEIIAPFLRRIRAASGDHSINRFIPVIKRLCGMESQILLPHNLSELNSFLKLRLIEPE